MINSTDLEAFDYYTPAPDSNDFDTYQEEVEKLMVTTGLQRLMENSLGLVGETGEIAEKLKKHIRDGRELDRSDMEKELGDALFYLAGLAGYFGFSLGSVASTNLKKLHDRKKRGVLQGSGDNR